MTNRFGCEGHVARRGERRGVCRVLVRKGKHWEDPSVDGRVILKWIFEKWDGGQGLDQSFSGKGQVACCYECGNELPDSIKCMEFFD